MRTSMVVCQLGRGWPEALCRLGWVTLSYSGTLVKS